MRSLTVLTIFLGAFLLFGVQPLVGGFLLPFFGGTATVWTVCLCAYQTLLVAGYFYAHCLAMLMTARRLAFHVVLIASSGIWCFVVGKAGWVSDALTGVVDTPVLGVLLAVLLVIGLPYVVLSSNSSVVQALSSRKQGEGKTYRLYAVSNAGSLCGLLFYPFVLEPRSDQSELFVSLGCGVLLYAVLVAVLVAAAHKGGEKEAFGRVAQQVNPGCKMREQGIWFGLSAFSCFLLNAVTTQLGQGVSPIPLMWAVLLSAYLASWIIGFADMGRLASRVLAGVALAAAVVSLILLGNRSESIFLTRFVVGTGLLFFGCAVAHNELYRSRPAETKLTQFYLMISVGGAVGGLLASLAFPLITTFVLEYPIALIGVLALAGMSFVVGLETMVPRELQRLLRVGGTASLCVLAALGIWFAQATDGNLVDRSRNFYSVTSIQHQKARDAQGREYPAITMSNNGTTHGLQALSYGSPTLQPTTYYTENGGGMGIVQHPLRKSGKTLRAGFCGMGIGTLAVHGREGDFFRFYEIDPDVIRYASDTNYFTFLNRSLAKIEVVEGDARQALEAERARNEEPFDLLVVDVFSGDAIPAHMATREAFKLYLDRLAPHGVLALHLSNWHLDLSPMVKAASNDFGLHLVGTLGEADPYRPYEFKSYWAYLSRRPMGWKLSSRQIPVDYSKVQNIALMTDGKHSLLPYVGRDPIARIEANFK